MVLAALYYFSTFGHTKTQTPIVIEFAEKVRDNLKEYTRNHIATALLYKAWNASKKLDVQY